MSPCDLSTAHFLLPVSPPPPLPSPHFLFALTRFVPFPPNIRTDKVGRCVESSVVRAPGVRLCVKWTPLSKNDSLRLLTASQPVTHTHPVARAVPDCSAAATFWNICRVQVWTRHNFFQFHSCYVIRPLKNDSHHLLLLKVILRLSKTKKTSCI